MGRVPDPLHELPREPGCPRGAFARAGPPDVAGADLRIVDHRQHENPGQRFERRSAPHAGHVHVRPPARQPERRFGGEHAQPLRGESPHGRSGLRTRVERVGRRYGQHALPIRQECGTHRGPGAQPEAQVGVRRTDRLISVQPADHRFGARVPGHRYRLRLLAGRQDRLRLLVVPDQSSRSRRAERRAQ